MDPQQSPRESTQPQEQSLRPQSTSSPPTSSSSSPKSVSHRRSASQLSLDLSALPPLTQPSPPSNTLLITQINDPSVFHPASLATIRQHITSISPLYSFSPLRSFRRIICSFYDTQSAISVRQDLDGAALLDNVRVRVYFGEPTPIGEQKKYLDRPDAGRLFFISPPPSPPVGWQVREEDPPNKDVHANDLAQALGKLRGKMGKADMEESSPVDGSTAMSDATMDKREGDTNSKPPLHVSAPTDADTPGSKPTSAGGASNVRNRSRSSTLIYNPEAHGDSPALPAVMVEDTTMDDTDNDSGEQVDKDVAATLDGPPSLSEGKKIMAHTSRPPVELM